MARTRAMLALGAVLGLLAGSTTVEPATRELVNTDSPQTLSNKTLVSPVLQGNVGIGTTSPQNALHVRSPGVQQLMLEGNSSWTQMGMKWSTNNYWTMGVGAGGGNNFFILNQLGPAGYVLAIDPTGNICFACPSSYGTPQAIDTKTGAYLSQGGVWTNASSRSLKQDIASLSSKEALQTLLELNPVTYRSKTDPQEQHVGFIAEEVPDLVATRDRKSLSPMDFVAVLTKVVQEQQREINALKARMKDF